MKLASNQWHSAVTAYDDSGSGATTPFSNTVANASVAPGSLKMVIHTTNIMDTPQAGNGLRYGKSESDLTNVISSIGF